MRNSKAVVFVYDITRDVSSNGKCYSNASKIFIEVHECILQFITLVGNI